MKRLCLALGGSVLAAGLGVTALAHDGQHKEGEEKSATVVGELVDTACFVSSDGDAKGKGHAKCASKCLGSGVPAGILPEGSRSADQMMFLLTNPTVLAPYASQTIKIEGTAHAKMHAIDVKKLYVKDGSGWKEVQLKDEHHKMTGGGNGQSNSTQKHEGHEKH